MIIERLQVKELTERDEYGRGIARISSLLFNKLGIKEGDVIDIKGEKITSAVALMLCQVDTDKKIIRIDGLVRKNCHVNIDDKVEINKATVPEAERVILTTEIRNKAVHISPNLIKETLYMRPIRKDDIILSKATFKRKNQDDIFKQMFGVNAEDIFAPFGSEIKFIVLKTIPKGPVKITESTEFILIPREENYTDEDYEKEMSIINIKIKPSLKNKKAVCSLKDIYVISNREYSVEKYKDKKFTIYFIGNYYFKTKNSKKKVKNDYKRHYNYDLF